LALSSSDAPTQGRTAVPGAMLLDISGAIGPATAEHVSRGLDHAARLQVKVVVLRLDTPGGLASSMREITSEILRSTVPVITYVAPSGARAASAGTYIVQASHLAAMAPTTHLGAATDTDRHRLQSGQQRKGRRQHGSAEQIDQRRGCFDPSARDPSRTQC
jgi:membrane-bound serine protease (ClpP class)